MTLRSALFALSLAMLTACVTSPVGSTDAAPKGSLRNFVVTIEGRNFIFDLDGRPTRFGFSASRNVSAKSASQAGEIAIRNVHDDETLKESLLNSPEDPPRVTATLALEVETFEAGSTPDAGYIFYRDRESK